MAALRSEARGGRADVPKLKMTRWFASSLRFSFPLNVVTELPKNCAHGYAHIHLRANFMHVCVMCQNTRISCDYGFQGFHMGLYYQAVYGGLRPSGDEMFSLRMAPTSIYIEECSTLPNAEPSFWALLIIHTLPALVSQPSVVAPS